jgi:5-methylcytosine-specific restriction protein A
MLWNILTNYLPVADLSTGKRQQLRELIELQLAELIRSMLSDDYTVKGRTGQGRWAAVPWVGIHHKGIHSDAQSGVYVAVLFRVDGSGLALSMQHGTDRLKMSQIRDGVKQVADQVAIPFNHYVKGPISIRTRRPNTVRLTGDSRPARYELANIIGREYEVDEIDDSVGEDLKWLVHIYEDWAREVRRQDSEEHYQLVELSSSEELSEAIPPGRQDRGSVRVGSLHPPRNPREGELALRMASYLCEANRGHVTFVTNKGRPYMEKHHLIPMEHYFLFERSLDHYSNIYSLCPTCHRRIHHGTPRDRESLMRQLYETRAETYQAFYSVSFTDIMRLVKSSTTRSIGVSIK